MTINKRKLLAALGAASAVVALFNAPIGGVIHVLREAVSTSEDCGGLCEPQGSMRGAAHIHQESKENE